MLTPLLQALTPLGRALLQPLIHLLFDQFTTPQSAPVTSPRNCEPGPGTLTFFDTSNVFSIPVGGGLRANGTLSAISNFVASVTGRSTGRMFLLKIRNRTTIAANIRAGFNNVNTNNLGGIDGLVYITANTLLLRDSGSTVDSSIAINSAATTHIFAFIQRSKGCLILFCDTDDNIFKLIWPAYTYTGTPFPHLSINTGVTVDFKVTEADIRDLAAPYDTDFGLAINRIATSSAGTTTTMTADGTVEHTITAATGVDQELEIRRATDTSSIVIKMLQVAGTIGVYTRTSGGVDTLVGTTAAQTWTNGTVYPIRVRAVGTSIKTYVASAPKNSVTTSVNQTETGVKVNRAGTDLATWPYLVSIPGV